MLTANQSTKCFSAQDELLRFIYFVHGCDEQWSTLNESASFCEENLRQMQGRQATWRRSSDLR
jgi:hypothetical protein